MIPPEIRQQLSDKEIIHFDMRLYGDLILGETVTLSQTVNTELLEPISAWIDDPDFMKQFDINLNDDAPNWADYKRKQRQWTGLQKRIAAERLRRYWREINRRRSLQKDLAKLFKPLHDTETPADKNNQYDRPDSQTITSILAAFSPLQQHKRETEWEFKQALDMHLSNLLPWRLIIADQLAAKVHLTFNDLTTVIKNNMKADTVSKFQHLLQMASDGSVTLDQPHPSSDIRIIPTDPNIIKDSQVVIKDKSGRSYEFEWRVLNESQRDKVITDAIERKIMCKKT